jgi:hypothetical protein
MQPIPGTITDPAVAHLLRTGHPVSDRDPGDEQPEAPEYTVRGLALTREEWDGLLALLAFAEGVGTDWLTAVERSLIAKVRRAHL